jgi:hypothetical protein
MAETVKRELQEDKFQKYCHPRESGDPAPAGGESSRKRRWDFSAVAGARFPLARE